MLLKDERREGRPGRKGEKEERVGGQVGKQASK